MSNNNIGCFGFLCIAIFIAFLWNAIIYIGIPLAMAGGGICYYMLKNEDEDIRLWGLIVGATAGLLGLVSIAANIYSDDGPFKSESEEVATDDTKNIIPEKYQGKWSANGNCDNYYSVIEIDDDSIDFPESISFHAESVSSGNNGSIIINGTTIMVANSLKDSGYQEERVKLSISNGGQSLSIKGTSHSRCEN